MIQAKKLCVVAMVLATSLAMASRDGLTLLRALKPGLENYHVETISKQTIKMPGAKDDQELTVNSVAAYGYKLDAPDSTGTEAPVELTTKVEKMDVVGPMADIMGANKDQLLKASTVNGKLDIRNRFTLDPKAKIDVHALLNGTLANTVVGLFVQFSDQPVKVTDAWDMVIPKGPLTYPEDQKLQVKLMDDTLIGGRSVYVLSLTGSLKSSIDVSKVLEDNPDPLLSIFQTMGVTTKGTIDVDGEVIVDKATGQTVTMNMKFATKQSITFQDQVIATSGTSIMKVTADKH